MNDIYSPPEADIRVPQDVEPPSFLKSLGGFILSLLAANLLNYVAGALYALVEPVDTSAAVTLYASAVLSIAINVAWIIAWPIYCRKQAWPNLYRGGRWHRILFVITLFVGIVIVPFFGFA